MTIDTRHLEIHQRATLSQGSEANSIPLRTWQDLAADPEALLRRPALEAERLLNAIPLEEQASLVLLTPWNRRQDLILLSTEAQALVQGLPVEELFWTVKAIGPQDSLHLLRLSSPEQLQFIFDLDWWRKAELQPDRIAAWMLFLFEASEDVVAEWFNWVMDQDETLLPTVMRLFLQVEKLPDGLDMQEARDFLPSFTLDDVYYVEFRQQEWEVLWGRALQILIEFFPSFYRDVMESLLNNLPAEDLEIVYRWRKSRLNDWGLPDYYEALEVYAPLPLGRERTIEIEEAGGSLPDATVLPAFVPTLYIGEAPVLQHAVQALAGSPVIKRITQEWVWVANKILMFDSVDLDDPAALHGALVKAATLLNLGLELLSLSRSEPPERILARILLEDIVRHAHKSIRKVVKEADRLVRDGRVEPQASYLSDDMSRTLRGLLMARPSLWDERQGDWRPFRSMSELSGAESIVCEIKQWSVLMALIPPSWREWHHCFIGSSTNLGVPEELTWPRALLTALAQNQLGGGIVVQPVPHKALPRLRDAWFGRREPESPVRGPEARAAMIPWETVDGLVNVLAPMAAEAGLHLREVRHLVETALKELGEDWAVLPEIGPIEAYSTSAMLTDLGELS